MPKFGPSRLPLGPKIASARRLDPFRSHDRSTYKSSQYAQIEPTVAIEPLMYERYDSEFGRSGS